MTPKTDLLSLHKDIGDLLMRWDKLSAWDRCEFLRDIEDAVAAVVRAVRFSIKEA